MGRYISGTKNISDIDVLAMKCESSREEEDNKLYSNLLKIAKEEASEASVWQP